MNKSLIVILLLLFPLTLDAGDRGVNGIKRFTFGAEWEYASSFHCGIHHNFFSQEGYRVDLNYKGFGYEGNGGVYAHCGYNLDNDWNLSLYTGFIGIYDIGRAIPVSLRLTRFFKENNKKDRWLCFIDAGSGLCIKKHPQMIAVGKIGGGYRLSLSRTTKLDFLISYRMSLTHPDVVFDGYEVSHEMINRNNAYVSALAAGVSLSF